MNGTGEKHSQAKLNWEAVTAIRANCAAGATQSSQAIKYGVSQMTISLIVRNKLWKVAA